MKVLTWLEHFCCKLLIPPTYCWLKHTISVFLASCTHLHHIKVYYLVQPSCPLLFAVAWANGALRSSCQGQIPVTLLLTPIANNMWYMLRGPHFSTFRRKVDYLVCVLLSIILFNKWTLCYSLCQLCFCSLFLKSVSVNVVDLDVQPASFSHFVITSH